MDSNLPLSFQVQQLVLAELFLEEVEPPFAPFFRGAPILWISQPFFDTVIMEFLGVVAS